MTIQSDEGQFDMSKASDEAMGRFVSRASKTEFDQMSPQTFGSWVNRLPLDEFFAMIDAHSKFMSGGGEPIEAPEASIEAPPALPPDDDAWVVYTLEGLPPLPDDAQCFVLYPDGSYDGPNRADAFLWGGDGQARILAYQPALLIS